MRTTTLVGTAFLVVVFAFSCRQSGPSGTYKDERAPAIADAAYKANGVPDSPSAAEPEQALSSSVATYADSSRRFILTGDLRFRADDVVKTSFAIEALVARHGGFVANTHLSTHISGRYTTPISADSSLETTRYTVNKETKSHQGNTFQNGMKFSTLKFSKMKNLMLKNFAIQFRQMAT